MTSAQHFQQSLKSMPLELDLLHGDPEGSWFFPSESGFKGWLSSKPQDEVFAKGWGWTGCPIWQYLRSCGWENPTVYRRGWWYPTKQSESMEEYRTPAWAAEFIWLIDLIKPREITPAECLNIFKNPVYNTTCWLNGRARPMIRSSTGLSS